MFHTNDDFLNAIAADPHERTLRLVYADWLAEHDSHDRAELIRVEEEMRLVPVFADRFWELKPRRNELRAQIGAEWCEQMRYGTECEPVFRHGIPDGWRERWRLIREFTERWHRVPMPDVGGRQAEIAEAETRLGRVLPSSVREWVAFAHDMRSGSNGVFFNLLCASAQRRQLGMSLLAGSDGSLDAMVPWSWGVQYTDFSQLDPPIVESVWNPGSNPRVTYPTNITPHVKSVTELALWYTTKTESSSNHLECYLGTLDLTHNQFRAAVEEAFPVAARCGALDLHEVDRVFVAFGMPDRGSGPRVRVKIAPDVAIESLPTFLQDVISSQQGDPIPF